MMELEFPWRTTELCRGEAALSDTMVALATMPASAESAAREMVFVRIVPPGDVVSS